MDFERELIIRRIKYLAHRRSTLELDVMLKRVVAGLDWAACAEQDLTALATVFEMDDVLLQKALMSRAPTLEGADQAVWEMMIAALERLTSV